MIHLIQDPQELSTWDNSPLGCRIFSMALGYGTEMPFLHFWREKSGCISLMDDVMTLAGDFEDPLELREFIHFSGTRTVFCENPSLSKRLGFLVSDQGPQMIRDSERPPIFRNLSHPISLKKMHVLLKACQTPSFFVSDFEPFYLDLNHRIRHQAADAWGIMEHNDLIACLAACISPKNALLFSGAVHPNRRRHGIFSAVIEAVPAYLPERDFFLCCEKSLCSYYQSLGYHICGQWIEMKTSP